jgi:two-component system, chemotaxis family, chemotaxis protein CheY
VARRLLPADRVSNVTYARTVFLGSPTVLPLRARRPPRHTVLVVDDFDDARDAIVTMLTTKGFDAVGAASGPIALDLFQAGMRPCVVLLDVRMPEMDGWEVWERMKAHEDLARMPVVILSANAADDTRAASVGIREFLRKPVDGRHLVRTVEAHCERHRQTAPTS